MNMVSSFHFNTSFAFILSYGIVVCQVFDFNNLGLILKGLVENVEGPVCYKIVTKVFPE